MLNWCPRDSLDGPTLIKQFVKAAVNGLGFDLSRHQPKPPTAFEVQKMMMEADRGLIIFDVGAHSGHTVIKYRRLFPAATIHAFEPTPGGCDYLRSVIPRDDRTFFHPLALSEREGHAEFHLNSSGSTNSLLQTDTEASPDWRPLLTTERIANVTTTTIDAFCASQGVPQIDILKLDVQGAEYRILEGARDMLASRRIRLVFLEVIVVPTYIGQAKPEDIFGLLGRNGLSIVDFYDLWRRGPTLLQFDALFALPEYTGRLAARV
jgi:FkbM family methyltransferase